MLNSSLKYTLPLLLITISCIAGVEIFYYLVGIQLDEYTRKPNTAEHQINRPAIEPESRPAAGPIDKQAIIERNLFGSRQGSGPPLNTDPLEGLEPSSLDVVLMGTVMGPDGLERAIIYDKKQKKQELFQEGEFIYQAVIKQILRGKVIVNLQGTDEVLDISEARNVKGIQVARAPKTVVQQSRARPVGTIPPQMGVQQVGKPVPAPVPNNTKPRQLRSFRGGVTVKGRNPAQVQNPEGVQPNQP